VVIWVITPLSVLMFGMGFLLRFRPGLRPIGPETHAGQRHAKRAVALRSGRDCGSR